jgi:uncharacterized delta-60 repeat protein
MIRAAQTHLLLAGLLAPGAAMAADGDLEPAFGEAGVAYVETALDDLPAAVTTDGEGRLVIASSGRNGTASSVFVVSRFTPDGDLDPTFDGDGIRAVGFTFAGVTQNFARDVEVLPDGRIVVVGYARDSASTSFAGALVRLLPNGALDPTLDGDGILVLAPAGQNHRFDRLAVRPNGNYVIAGSYDDTVLDRQLALVEFLPTGAAVGFNTVDLFSSQDESAVELLLEPDGRMVAAALAFNVDEVVITRWHTNYVLDTSYGGDGIGHHDWAESIWAADLDRLEDGRYVLGVQSDSWTAFEWLLPSGASDPATCNSTPSCIYDDLLYFSALAAQSDGRILAVGSSEASDDVRVWRLASNGALDTTFGNGGVRDFDCAPGAPASSDGGAALALSGGRAVALGIRSGSPADDGLCLARLTSSLIFRSGFESGPAWGWSSNAI